MRAFWKGLVPMALAPALVIVGAGAAIAAPPSNDRETGALVVGAVPFTHTVDTTQANANGPRFCSNEVSVFYSFTPAEDVHVQVDLLGSDYDTMLGIYTRDAAGRVARIGCSDDRLGYASGLRLHAVAGTTYLLMAGSYYDGSGGRLVLTVTEVAAVALEYTFEVTDPGTIDPGTGIATISGTVTCNKRSAIYEEGTLRQLRQGIFLARGWWSVFVTCTPEAPAVWTREIDTDTSVVFGSGSATMRSSYSDANDGWRDWVSHDPSSIAIQLV